MARAELFDRRDPRIQTLVESTPGGVTVVWSSDRCVRCLVGLRAGDRVKVAKRRGQVPLSVPEGGKIPRQVPKGWGFRHAICDGQAIVRAREAAAERNDQAQIARSDRRAARSYTSGGALTVEGPDGSVRRLAPYKRIEIRAAVKASHLDKRAKRRRGN